MFNGRKNTVIGLTAIFTFVLVELAAIVQRSSWCFSSPSTWIFRFSLPATSKAGASTLLADIKRLLLFTHDPRDLGWRETAEITRNKRAVTPLTS